ncbi:MAG: glutathione S-transferase N-terminal domain-containing protein [Alphaproteobacteria bacterium]|nr:glutathione S-transferase N-terminal domain-containing protein [Alphaproteobacteria bacterium]MCB9795382.1 glutathione S-transferase N-terminal domain-containing protein [Alphaproteobacteria bacterium]
MSVFPAHWPVAHPERIQLYTLGTPNGVKASIALEELGLPYEAHRVDFGKREQHDPGFLEFSPNNKIPALIDPDGPGGAPIRIFESGAILHYLAKKAGRLLPTDPAGENEALRWMFFQVGSVGAMFGQYGHFVAYAPKDQDHAYATARYTQEALRILAVLEQRLEGRDWILDDFSIVDIMTAPWVGAFDYYGGPVVPELAKLPNVTAWTERFKARPAVQRGMKVPG